MCVCACVLRAEREGRVYDILKEAVAVKANK